LVLTIGLQQQNPSNLGALAIGSILMVMIFMGGHISGAHYNPSVTLGVRLTGRAHIGTAKAVVYVLLQLLAGFLAAGTAYALADLKGTFTPMPQKNPISGEWYWGRAFVAELLYTFALVSVMLNTATTKSQNANSFFGLAIGFTVFAGAVAAGPISGGAFNPAVVTGPTFVAYLVGAENATLGWFWMYWIAEILGSLLASIIFRMTNTAEYRHQAAIADASNRDIQGYKEVPSLTEEI